MRKHSKRSLILLRRAMQGTHPTPHDEPGHDLGHGHDGTLLGDTERQPEGNPKGQAGAGQ